MSLLIGIPPHASKAIAQSILAISGKYRVGTIIAVRACNDRLELG